MSYPLSTHTPIILSRTESRIVVGESTTNITLDTLTVLVRTTAPAWPQGTGGDMLRANNLSELTDNATARSNLDVYSKTEIGEHERNFITDFENFYL